MSAGVVTLNAARIAANDKRLTWLHTEAAALRDCGEAQLAADYEAAAEHLAQVTAAMREREAA